MATALKDLEIMRLKSMLSRYHIKFYMRATYSGKGDSLYEIVMAQHKLITFRVIQDTDSAEYYDNRLRITKPSYMAEGWLTAEETMRKIVEMVRNGQLERGA